MIHGSDEFFSVTKTVHNALQGADVEWTTQMERVYLERVLDNALQLEGEWDYVVMHDPQPAAMLDYARNQGVAHESTKWIWRCHIDLTDANPHVWNVLPGRSSSSTTRRCGRCREFVPDVDAARPHRVRAAVHRPALGEEPRDAAPVRGGDHPPVRRAARTIRSSCR